MQSQVTHIQSRLRQIIFALALLFNASCATSQKGKIVEGAIIGAVIGGAYGASRPDYQDKNAMMFGAMGAAIGAVALAYHLDPDKHSEQLKAENTKLKKELDLISNPKVIFESPATFNSKIPDKYKKLVNPGEWRISEIDQWLEEGENRLIHQDKIMELIPPSLQPNQQGDQK